MNSPDVDRNEEAKPEAIMSESRTAQIIQDVIENRTMLNGEGLADSLVTLITSEPVRWRQLLLFADFWPNPSPQQLKGDNNDLSQTLDCLLRAIHLVSQRSSDLAECAKDMMLTLNGYSVLQSYYHDIREELAKLDFVKDPAEVQIHRLVAFVESQSRSAEMHLIDMQAEQSYYDTLTGHAASVSGQFDSSKSSPCEAYETTCETIELGLRMILHSHKLPTTPSLRPDHGPFNDPDIAKFVTLAGIWRMVTDAWSNMRFRGWRWICDSKGRSGCVPVDNESYVREQAGSIRYDLFLGQQILRSAADKGDSKKYLEALNDLAQSITIPEAGQVWCGSLSAEAMKECYHNVPFKDNVEQYVNKRHYAPMIDRVKAASIGWRDWCEGKAAMYCLADAIAKAATIQLPDDDLSCMRQVVVIRNETLVGILVQCGALSAEKAAGFVKLLQFDPKRKSLEIWDQPLIPCGVDAMFIVPTLVKSGSPARTLENFVSQWGGASFDVRGTPFEKWLVTEIHSRSGAYAQSGIKVEVSRDEELQFDVVVWWEGYLLLLEAKCEKTVFSAADYHRAKGQVDKSIDQLVIRRRALPMIWSKLREKAQSLKLPEDYIGDDRVLCISITNIMDFTGYSRDGVIVTDDSCFFRFFGKRMICKRSVEGDIEEEVEPIRASEVPHPSELMPYLLNPAPMRIFTDKITLLPHVIPAITERSPGFFSVHVEFDPSRDGRICEWQPSFVTETAYAIAVACCQTGLPVNVNDLRQDAGLLVGAKELISDGIIGATTDTPWLLELKIQDPVCIRLPDGRHAVGENVCGQMSWWVSKYFPNEVRVLSPQFARFLVGEGE